MADRIAKRRIAVWGVLAVLFVALALSGCKKQSEPTTPAPPEPNATTTAPADG